MCWHPVNGYREGLCRVHGRFGPHQCGIGDQQREMREVSGRKHENFCPSAVDNQRIMPLLGHIAVDAEAAQGTSSRAVATPHHMVPEAAASMQYRETSDKTAAVS